MENPKPKEVLAPSKLWRLFFLSVILICGFGTRLYDLTDPPLDYAAARQLRSAMIARGKYYAALSDVAEWKQEIARKQQNIHGMIEPEIIEGITVITYRLAGGEYVWIARIYSSLFWTLGGLALYFLIKDLVSGDGAIIALIYYLFAPFGLIASRTFQPDPLMTGLIIVSWTCFYYWYKTSTWMWAVAAGLSAGLALYVKSTSIFFLLPSMMIVILFKKKFVETLKDLQVWVIGLIAAVPVAAYHIYGLFITKELESQLRGRFFPQMWNDLDFYIQWKNALSNVTGHYLILLIGLLGLFLIKERRNRTYLLGIWAGYLLYGFTLSYHISTHYYYTLPVIPLLAISLGEVAERIIRLAWKIKLEPVFQIGTALLLIAGVGGGNFLLEKDDYRNEPPYYKKVADYVEPEDKIVALSQDYGYRLSFYGWRVVYPWKGTEDLRYIKLRDSEIDSFSERFSKYSTDYDYFIVTRLQEFRRQQDLYNELYNHYQVLAEGGGYVIFDLRDRSD